MRKLSFHAVPAARPAPISVQPRLGAAARQMLKLTTRTWLPAALLRPRPDCVRLDDRVRLSGEW